MTDSDITNPTPSLFRVTVEVGDLDRAVGFYRALLGIEGRVLPGARCYFDCGPVTLAVQQVPPPLRPAAKSLYLEVADVDAAHARAAGLDCLSPDAVHGEPAGQIVRRPWGERSFYVEDPWGNPLCFVDRATVYTGR
jgi:catechol 2,3-dioxygenase-like lactoylglutathione lyase family enzyme